MVITLSFNLCLWSTNISRTKELVFSFACFSLWIFNYWSPALFWEESFLMFTCCIKWNKSLYISDLLIKRWALNYLSQTNSSVWWKLHHPIILLFYYKTTCLTTQMPAGQYLWSIGNSRSEEELSPLHAYCLCCINLTVDFREYARAVPSKQIPPTFWQAS